MANSQLRLSIRAQVADVFELEIEDAETVEALGVVIFSMRPDLGEDLRLVHRGRVLKPEDELRKYGIQTGDVVAVARMPKAGQPQEPVQAPAETSIAPSMAKDESGSGSSKGYPNSGPSDTMAQEDKSQEECIMEDKPTNEPCPMVEKDTHQKSSSAQPDTEMQCAPDAVQADEPNAESSLTLANGLPQESTCASPDVEMQSTPNEERSNPEGNGASAEEPTLSSRLDEMSPGAALLELAKSFEDGTLDGHPATIVAALRTIAARVESLEGNLAEASQALMLLNHLSARALQGLGAGGGGGLAGLMGSNGSAPEEEAPRSFLVKKGDSDLQEMHRQPPVLKRGSSGGGVLSSASSPMSKEDMDKARKARLDRLEAQQASKKRELEEAEERTKSREAMFNRPFAGSAKPLGKF